jgi:hypothetical protein
MHRSLLAKAAAQACCKVATVQPVLARRASRLPGQLVVCCAAVLSWYACSSIDVFTLEACLITWLHVC